MSNNSQWTSERPTKDGNYWLMHQGLKEPQIVHIWDTDSKHGGYVDVYEDGNMGVEYPKVATFCKCHVGILWCEVVCPPLPENRS